MPLIPEDKIAEIRDRTDIVQIVGEYVPLKRSGVNWKGLCPFHAERTPSFNVNQAKQMYHCFGCGKSGDVIRFVTEHDGKSFLEVVRELARRAGVELPEPEVTAAEREAKKRAESDRARLLKLNRLVCDWLREQYAAPGGARARAYVEEKRGIEAAIRDAFLLGYAPPGWDALTRHLEAKKVPHELAESAGLVKARDHARLPPGVPPTRATHFDLFRDRVMFPLISPQGEVIAFSGRALEDAGPDGQKIPKYINSPETILYKKGENLYGLHVARAAIRRAERAVLVEGNFDVLMMHQHGFGETVAPMGTALTPAQVRLLSRAAPRRVYLLLDGDSAGSSAAARNVGLFLDEDQLSFVALLPRGDDPDTFVRRAGREALELLFTNARESVEYFCEYGWNRTGSSVIERARLLEDEAAPIIRKVRIPAARQRYAERLALTLALPIESVQRVLRGGPVDVTRRPRPETPPSAPVPSGAAPIEPLSKFDWQVMGLVAQWPELLQRLDAVLDVVDNASLREALGRIAASAPSGKLSLVAFAEHLPEPLQREVMAAAAAGPAGSSTDSWHASFHDVSDPDAALRDIARHRQAHRVASELPALKRQIAEASARGDNATVQRLNARITEMQQALHGLKG